MGSLNSYHDLEKPIKSAILVFGGCVQQSLHCMHQEQQQHRGLTTVPSLSPAAMEAEAAPLIKALGLKCDEPAR